VKRDADILFAVVVVFSAVLTTAIVLQFSRNQDINLGILTEQLKCCFASLNF